MTYHKVMAVLLVLLALTCGYLAGLCVPHESRVNIGGHKQPEFTIEFEIQQAPDGEIILIPKEEVVH